MSVTPLLSRTLEKIVVRNWLLPAIPNEWVCDQYGFRPTGSTACALTDHVTATLEHCEYVPCLLIDFQQHLMSLNIQYYCLNFPSSIATMCT